MRGFTVHGKSYGEPHRRPEVQSGTIEFIAPSEYMVSLTVNLTGDQRFGLAP